MLVKAAPAKRKPFCFTAADAVPPGPGGSSFISMSTCSSTNMDEGAQQGRERMENEQRQTQQRHNQHTTPTQLTAHTLENKCTGVVLCCLASARDADANSLRSFLANMMFYGGEQKHFRDNVFLHLTCMTSLLDGCLT